MKKREISFLLRIDKDKYNKLKVLADKYDRSINSEINLILDYNLQKWETKKIIYKEVPQELNNIQNDINDKEYLEALQFLQGKKQNNKKSKR